MEEISRSAFFDFALSCRAIKLTHSLAECTYRIMGIFRKILVNTKKGDLEKDSENDILTVS